MPADKCAKTWGGASAATPNQKASRNELARPLPLREVATPNRAMARADWGGAFGCSFVESSLCRLGVRALIPAWTGRRMLPNSMTAIGRQARRRRLYSLGVSELDLRKVDEKVLEFAKPSRYEMTFSGKSVLMSKSCALRSRILSTAS